MQNFDEAGSRSRTGHEATNNGGAVPAARTLGIEENYCDECRRCMWDRKTKGKYPRVNHPTAEVEWEQGKGMPRSGKSEHHERMTDSEDASTELESRTIQERGRGDIWSSRRGRKFEELSLEIKAYDRAVRRAPEFEIQHRDSINKKGKERGA
ncbi:hypothetical protein FB451DRAFT_1169844 [Mycena latifolia]|nr:hypothetical protein FB451DRAFT_1169844 [Mycena latifolia]